MKNDEVSKFFAGLFYTLLLNLNSPFLDIILGIRGFFRPFLIFRHFMETLPCAKCIKSGILTLLKGPENEKNLNFYSFLRRRFQCFREYSVNHMYKESFPIQMDGSPKAPSFLDFSAFFLREEPRKPQLRIFVERTFSFLHEHAETALPSR